MTQPATTGIACPMPTQPKTLWYECLPDLLHLHLAQVIDALLEWRLPCMQLDRLDACAHQPTVACLAFDTCAPNEDAG